MAVEQGVRPQPCPMVRVRQVFMGNENMISEQKRQPSLENSDGSQVVRSVYLASMAGVSSGGLKEVIETLFEVELALSKWRTLDDKKHPSGSLTSPSTGGSQCSAS